VTITTLIDSSSDVFLVDQGPAKRHRAGGPNARRPAATMEGGATLDTFVAEHGFSALIGVKKGEREHQVLFDTGVSPNGMVENLSRLDLSPKDVEAVVLSHGHFDHTTGLDGLIRAVGRANLPVTIHPEFWTRRRITLPGREPQEIPTTSKSALLGAGFEIIEERRPSFLLDRSLLVTGEVDRTTGYEPGFPPQQKFAEERGSRTRWCSTTRRLSCICATAA